MRMREFCPFLLAVCFLSTVLDGKEAEIRANPQEIAQFLDLKFVYDESWVLDHLERVTGPPVEGGELTKQQQEIRMIELAWYIVCLGEYSQGNVKVERAIFNALKYADNTTVPYWVCTVEQHRNILAFYAGVNPDTGSAFFTAFVDRRLIYQMGRAAMASIEKRNGFKFTEYAGPHYATP